MRKLFVGAAVLVLLAGCGSTTIVTKTVTKTVTQTLSRTDTSARSVVLFNDQWTTDPFSEPDAEPSEVELNQGLTLRMYLIEWTTWGGPSAIGSGNVSGPAAGNNVKGTIKLSRIRDCATGNFYTRVTATLTPENGGASSRTSISFTMKPEGGTVSSDC